MKPRLLIVTTHPIQYQAPWFRALHVDDRLELKVLFLSLPNAQQQGIGFDHAFEWDVSLLDGYDWAVANSATGQIDRGWWGLRVPAAEADISVHTPDAILITGWQKRGMLECLLGARKLGLPVILRAESNGLDRLGALKRLKGRWIAKHAQVLLPIGSANHQYYERLGLHERIGLPVPYFVNNEFFLERSGEVHPRRSELRKRHGIPEHACCFLFAGKLAPKKHPEDVLAAIERADRETNTKIHLLVVGTGPLKRELRERVEERSLPVTFAGFLNQSEMPAAYAAGDCLVLPSDYGETWGLVVNEAMACGLPAIVSDRVGCGPDLVSNGETGFTFRFGDVDDFASRMTQVANMDESERKVMGERARDRVMKQYSIERAVENTVAATLELLEQRHKGSTH